MPPIARSRDKLSFRHPVERHSPNPHFVDTAFLPLKLRIAGALPRGLVRQLGRKLLSVGRLCELEHTWLARSVK
jgi:hypothetical protein